MDTDTAAIKQWINERDSEAFQTLVIRYSAMVYATCRRVMGNATDAEDAAQESFQALAMLRQPPKGEVGPWLHRVAVYKSLNRLRADKRREKRGKAYAKRAAGAETVWDDLYEFVDEAIADLPEKYRQPVVRHFLQGETQEAIAQNMGLTRQTVAYRIQCGIEGIRKSLRRRGVAVTAVALSGLLTANVVEAAPASLIESLGKVALMGTSVPAQPLTFLARIQSSAFSLKGAAVVFIVVGAILAGVIHGPYYWKMHAIKRHGISLTKRSQKERTRKTAPQTSQHIPRSAPPVPKPLSAVSPEFEPAPPVESEKSSGARGAVPPLGEIQGCLRTESGKPQAGTEVLLTRTLASRWANAADEKLQWTATTDAEGRFAFSNLPVCAENLLRGRQLFRLSAQSGDQHAETDFQMHFWEFNRFQELVLRPASFIECAALNEQGVPVSCGKIEVEDASRMGRRLPVPEPVALGPDGHAKIGPLFPGTYLLKTQVAGYAQAAQIVGHDARQVRILLKPQPAIMGHVLDAETGAPIAGVKVFAKVEGKKIPAGFSTSDAGGAYFIALKTETDILLYAYSEEKCLPGGWMKIQADPRLGKNIDLELVQGGTVSGHAFDPITGKGVPNIPVCFSYSDILMLDSFINTYTDENGAYTLHGVCGKGAVKMLDWWDAKRARPFEVATGQVLENVDFTLERSCRIAGRVVNAQNQPQADIVVAARPIRNPEKLDAQDNMRYVVSSTDNAGGLTDADGRFVCFLLGYTGMIYLQAMGKNCSSTQLGPYEVPETGLAGLLVRVEQTGGLDGRIVNEQLQPLSSASVGLEPVDATRGSMLFDVDWPYASPSGSPFHQAAYRVTSLGDFAFRALLPGKYRLMAYVNASALSLPLAEQEVTIEAGAVQTVQLAVPTARFSGVRGVVKSKGRPQPNLKIEILGGEHVEELITTTAADGSYVFTQLLGERAWLMVSNPEKHDSLAEARVDLVPGQIVTYDIDVPVGNGRVEGIVRRSGVPASGRELYLMPLDGADGQTLSANTDLQGRFVMENVVAGIYVLGIMKPGGYGANPTQSLIFVKDGETATHNFNIGGATIAVSVQGVQENERGHIVIVQGENIIEELTEESLMALAPQAVKYLRMKSETPEYSFADLGPGTYTVYCAAHPKETGEGEDVLNKMRVLYAIVNAADNATTPAAFDFSVFDAPETNP